MSATVHVFENGLRVDTWLGAGFVGNAIFSPEPEPVYRYWLSRQWSTADAERLDPTVRRCLGFARLWGCGRLVVVNLFALRATDPRKLRLAADPVGPLNTEHIRLAADVAVLPQAQWTGATGVVCAWGTSGKFAGPKHNDQGQHALDVIRAAGAHPLALGTTKQGHPKHPLYLPRILSPVAFGPPTLTPGPHPQ